MLITADQIRAARALKNWSQTDLAERTGLAVPTIANIELGKQIPGKNTIEKIIDAFSIGGIRFTANGVEFDKNEIVTIKGDDKFVNILYDMEKSFQKKPVKERVLLVFNVDESLTSKEEDTIYERMKDHGAVIKQIASEKAKDFPRYFVETSIIPDKYFDKNGAVFVFNDRVAIYTLADNPEDATTHIITNPRIAEAFTKIFAYMWDNLPKVELKPNKKKGRK